MTKSAIRFLADSVKQSGRNRRARLHMSEGDMYSYLREGIADWLNFVVERRPEGSIGPFAAGAHMVHAGGQAAHWDIQNKATSSR